MMMRLQAEKDKEDRKEHALTNDELNTIKRVFHELDRADKG